MGKPTAMGELTELIHRNPDLSDRDPPLSLGADFITPPENGGGYYRPSGHINYAPVWMFGPVMTAILRQNPSSFHTDGYTFVKVGEEETGPLTVTLCYEEANHRLRWLEERLATIPEQIKWIPYFAKDAGQAEDLAEDLTSKLEREASAVSNEIRWINKTVEMYQREKKRGTGFARFFRFPFSMN